MTRLGGWATTPPHGGVRHSPLERRAKPHSFRSAALTEIAARRRTGDSQTSQVTNGRHCPRPQRVRPSGRWSMSVSIARASARPISTSRIRRLRAEREVLHESPGHSRRDPFRRRRRDPQRSFPSCSAGPIRTVRSPATPLSTPASTERCRLRSARCRAATTRCSSSSESKTSRRLWHTRSNLEGGRSNRLRKFRA